MNSPHSHTYLTVAERKQRLLAESTAYRSAIAAGTHQIKAGLPAASLAKSAAAYLTAVGVKLFKGDGSGGGSGGFAWQTLAPLLISGVSALSKKSLLKPAIRSVLVAAAIGMVAGVIVKRKKAHPSGPAAGHDTK